MGLVNTIIVPNQVSFLSDTDFSSTGGQYHAVKLGSDVAHIAICGSAGRAVGILMNKPNASQAAEVAIIGGGAFAKLDATCSAMSLLISTASGTLTPATASGQFSPCLSLSAGSAGGVIPVLVQNVMTVAAE